MSSSPSGDVLADLLAVVHRCSRTATMRLVNPLSASHYRALAVVRDQGPLRLGELAELVRVSQPGMTKIVSTLAADGLVSRAADPEDQRARMISIAPAGRDFLRSYARELSAALTEDISDLSSSELATLEAATTILTSRLDS